MSSKAPEAKMKSLQMVLETGFCLLDAVHSKINRKDRNAQVNDALIVFQMILGKGLAIKKLATGLEFENSINGTKTSGLVDPTPIAVLARTQFEAFANFYNIFNSTDDQKLTDLLYDMWVIAGLNERQRTVSEDMNDGLKKKAESERKEIEELRTTILENPCFKNLDEQRQNWFRERIRKRDFELLFKDGKFTKPGWRELFLNADVKDVFMHLYSAMCLSAHPSNVSVFQYSQMFDKGFNNEMTFTYVGHSTIIMSFMIAEYCKYFSLAKDKFEKLPDLHKLIVDSYNGIYRGKQNEISDVRDKYEEEFQSAYEKFMKEQ